MAEVFTHKFKFAPGTGRFISGDIEFDKDGKCTFNIEKSSNPILQEDFALFNKFIELIMSMESKELLEEISFVKK